MQILNNAGIYGIGTPWPLRSIAPHPPGCHVHPSHAGCNRGGGGGFFSSPGIRRWGLDLAGMPGTEFLN